MCLCLLNEECGVSLGLMAAWSAKTRSGRLNHVFRREVFNMLGYFKIPKVVIAQTHICVWLYCRFSLFDSRSLAKRLSIQVLHRLYRLIGRGLKAQGHTWPPVRTSPILAVLTLCSSEDQTHTPPRPSCQYLTRTLVKSTSPARPT